jgi:hypothetical protein
MAEKEYIPEGEDDHISKLAFSAVAAPSQPPSTESTNPHEIRDLDQYVPKGPPASTKEVWSYYLYYAANNGIGSFQ